VANSSFQQFDVVGIREVLDMELHGWPGQASTSCSINDRSSK
jgi:hypothetical protein